MIFQKELKELKDQEKIMKNKLAKILSNEKFIKEKELYNSQRQLNIRPVPTKINISLEKNLIFQILVNLIGLM